VIAEYFTDVYKRPDNIQVNLNMVVPEDNEILDEMINTTALFNLDDIMVATPDIQTLTRDSYITALTETFSRK
jgi:hypothetical protein